MVEQRLVRGETDHGQRCGVGQGDGLGRRREGLGRREDVLRGGAGLVHRQEADDVVADLESVHALAQRIDRACDIEAGSVRQHHRDGALHEAAADVAVDGVERGRGDTDADLPGAGDGLLHVLVAQDAGVTTWPAPATTSGPDGRRSHAVFAEGVLEALRTWHTPREFPTSVLLHSPLVPHGSRDSVADLRGAITTALDAIQTDPAGVKAHEALTTTYITACRTHRAAARRLGVPYGTYRRHLTLAKERLVERLLRQLATASTPPER
ncbi:hypothetical protein FBY22_3369 [Streptomyces sp. SLBN-31]|nr:hypothetical protein FBY22_3369 [Streptomyces sp. SLBN-31]